MARTSNSIVLDASAVIESLYNKPKGIKVAKALQGSVVYITPTCISEIIAYAQQNGFDPELTLRSILDLCIVVETRAELAYDAGMFYSVARKKKPKFSHGDATVLAAADMLKARIVTCDNDFAGVANATVVR